MTFKDDAQAATTEMRSVFPATPLLRNDLLSARYDADIWLKREDLSPVRSYKLRGAFNAMRKVIPGGKPRAGRGVHVPPFRRAWRDFHAGDDAAAKGAENADVRRRCGRGEADR